MTRSRQSSQVAAVRTVRCAIYTRKSSDEGLGQQFNTLEAQRAGGEAFVLSRSSEGWVCLPDRYDDGGFSGGSMERPALKRLLEDVEAGRIDVVVIYKLDRLTRSIRDFARIMESLEARGVAIAAVSQAINTGDSMGRLMVNVLMSFAQFERELASERTRDKIAASRKKGIWTGGRPILGYDYAGSKLVVNATEAQTVRSIFAWYIELQSLRALLRRLTETGVNNKAWQTRDGRPMGGRPFVLSGVAQLLSNPLYIGRVPHHDAEYEGQHEGIVDPAVFKRVQELLAENKTCGASLKHNRYGGLLKGLLVCQGCGAAMVHTSTSKCSGGGSGAEQDGGSGGARVVYRYYTCRTPALVGKRVCKSGNVAADQIERFVLERVKHEFARPDIVGLVFDALRHSAEGRVRDLESRLALAQANKDQAEAQNAPTAARGYAREAEVVGRDLARARREVPTRASVEAALRDFDGLWSSLTPTERSGLVARVVRRVRFDAGRGEITIERRGAEAPAGEEAA